MMAVDFKTFCNVAPHVIAVRKPVLLRGRHGVGKSEVVYQVAEAHGLPVVERRASQMTEGDLIGLPKTDGDVTSFCPPDWFQEACDTPVVLFFDEVDRAVTEVRQGLFELTDSRKLFGKAIHPDTVILAAVNGGEHGSQYQVGEMDPAELDRWTVFDVEPTVEDWLEWGKNNVDGLVWDFINQNRSHLEHTEDYEPNKVYPSRRSWKRLNDCLLTAGLLSDGQRDDSNIYHLSAAFVGMEAAIAFNDFAQNYERQVTVEMILNDGQISKTSDFGINEHCALIEKMEASDTFAVELAGDNIQNLANYFVTLPSEAAMKLWTVLGKGDNTNVIGLHKSTATDGTKVSARMVQMLTGNND
jgi:hypothetical protein